MTYTTGKKPSRNCFGLLDVIVVPVKMAFGGIKNMFFGSDGNGDLKQIDESLLVSHPVVWDDEDDEDVFEEYGIRL